ncbi:LytR/AlgR family response regulator transcription factor [Cellvibrio sp. NN19]|uniref:LytR/AlgR family response regulator transcription factor n=1 Tax=Cellvibrio chitinivorans TaxID=3102792 RepID=UPI002B40BB8E|nr:response regulator [Cellvibrio sp. NN19]
MIKALIVDDERLARAELKRLLAAHPQIDICAEAASADEAKQLLAEFPINLVFLDIQMPGTNGLELAATLNPQLQFVFCTAFDSFALDAFELNALDYLVKPINPDRLAKTLQRLTHTPAQQPQANYLPESHGLLLKFGDNKRIVRLSEINRFESVGNHSAVYTCYGKSFLHSSLSKIEQRLDPQQFFRASRADIVRVSAIKELETGLTPGSMLAILQDDQIVEVSRRQVQVLRTVFGGF